MKTVTYFTILASFAFLSCEDRIDLESKVGSKLLIECEMQAEKMITAKVYMLNEFDDVVRDSVVKDAVLRLTTGIDEQITFIYDEDKNYYFVEPKYHLPSTNRNYSMVAYHPEMEEVKMSATLTLPLPMKMEAELQGGFDRSDEDQDLSSLEFTVKAKVPEVTKGKSYFRLYTYIINSLGKAEQVIFEGNDEDPLAFQKSVANGSVLIDLSRVNHNDFYMKFSTISKYKKAEKPKQVLYTLTTLTEESYMYHVAKNKAIKASKNGSRMPIVVYSNFQNGLGLFGGIAPASDTIIIK